MADVIYPEFVVMKHQLYAEDIEEAIIQYLRKYGYYDDADAVQGNGLRFESFETKGNGEYKWYDTKFLKVRWER